MNKETAKLIVGELVRCQQAMDRAEQLMRTIDDEGLRNDLRKSLASAWGSIYSDVLCRVLARFPELNPYPNSRRRERPGCKPPLS